MNGAVARLRAGLQRGPLSHMVWIGLGFGGLQIIRFATNIALAWLLAPSVFGAMLIFNTIRTGVELLTDIGIGQNVIANPDGHQPQFFRTAWTLQILRGGLMALGTLAIAPVIGHFYADELFHDALPVLALIFLLSGFQSTGRFLLQRDSNLKGVAIFEVAAAFVAAAVQIILSYYYPNVWSLVYGALISTVATVIISFALTPSRGVGLTFDRKYAIEIFSFGRWLFLSTMIYYLASNFDRLYLGKVIPFALLGIYGVARSLSEMATLLAGRVSSLLIFPVVAKNSDDRPTLEARLKLYYQPLALLTAIAFGSFAALSDVIVRFLYDSRYWFAGDLLPILIIGVWFATLASIGDGILLGLRKPALCLVANVSKAIWLVVMLPLGFLRFGLIGAVLASATADFPRYIAITLFLHRARIRLSTIELLASALLVTSLVVTRTVTHALGLSGGLDSLFAAFHP